MTRLLVALTVLCFVPGCDFDPPGSVLDSGAVGSDAAEATGESLTVTFTTVNRAGAYAPAHVVAVWIEDAAGDLVQTIGGAGSNAGYDKLYLLAWAAKGGSAPNAPGVDAVSGATLQTHDAPIVAKWNIGAEVAAGTYTIRMETAEDNVADPADNAQATLTFEKNGTASTQTPTAENYLDISVDYSGAP